MKFRFNYFSLIILILISVCLGTGCGAPSGIPTPEPKTRDLAWDGKYLWAAGSGTDKVYRINSRGKVVSSFKTPESGPGGLTWDGENLWVATHFEDMIFKMSVDGEVLESFTAPCDDVEGLAWIDDFLYCSEKFPGPDRENRIYKIDPTTGEILENFKSPNNTHNGGLAYDGEYLLLVTPTPNQIYKIDPYTGELIEQIDLHFGIARPSPMGITWDGRKIWIAYIVAEIIEPLE